VHTPVVSVTWESEAGGSVESRNLRACLKGEEEEGWGRKRKRKRKEMAEKKEMKRKQKMIKNLALPDMVARTCNPRTQEAEAGESHVRGQSGLHMEFEASLGFIVSHCLKK
jgi:hypothetical protein